MKDTPEKVLDFFLITVSRSSIFITGFGHAGDQQGCYVVLTDELLGTLSNGGYGKQKTKSCKDGVELKLMGALKRRLCIR